MRHFSSESSAAEHDRDEVLRVAEVHTARQALESSRSVILAGEFGIGKTHLLTVLSRGVAGSRPVVWLKGLASRMNVPWAAAAQAFGLPPDEATIRTALRERVAALTEGGSAPLIVADDVHLLDRDSAEWLTELVYDEAALCLAALDSGAIGEEYAHPEAVRAFRLLWANGDALRIDLEPLSEEQSERMIRLVLRDTTIDSATRLYLRQRAAGIPLLVRELALDAVGSRLAAPAAWRLLPSTLYQPTARIVELFAHRVRSLSESELEALVLLAKLDSMEQHRAAQLVGAEILRTLIRRGHVAVSAPAAVLSARRIDAEIALVGGASTDLGPVSRNAVRVLLADRIHGIQPLPLEAMLIAEAATESGPGALGELCDEFGAGNLAEVLLLAARKANAIGLFRRALTYATAVGGLGGSPAAKVEALQALVALGNEDSAKTMLADVGAEGAAAAPTPFVKLATVAMHEMPGDDPLRYSRVFESAPPARAELALQRLWDDVIELRLHRVDEARALVHDLSAPVTSRLRAAGVVALSCALAGDRGGLLGAVALVEAAKTSAARLGPLEPVSLRGAETTARAMCWIAAALARQDLPALAGEVDHAIDDALRFHDIGQLSTLGIAAGMVAAARGDHRTAADEFRLASLRYSGVAPYYLRAWVAPEEAASLAVLGLTDDATRALADHRSTAPKRLLSFRAGLAEVALLSADGRVDDAVELALSLAEDSGGSPVLAAEALFRAFVLGSRDGAVAAGLSAAAADTDLESVRTLDTIARAATDGDATAVDTAARDLVRLGMTAEAEAGLQLAIQLHESIGARKAATAARSTLATLRSRSSGESRSNGELAVLTSREHEVALLAGQGRTNREIAAQLYLSVRTVESHVYQALAKLGAASRRELAGLLARNRDERDPA